MSWVKSVWTLFKVNWKTALVFEVFFKTFLLAFIVPLCAGFFGFALYLQGYSYVTAQTFSAFLSSPISILFMICMLALFAFCFLFETCALFSLLRLNRENESVSVMVMCQLAFSQVRRVFRWGGVLILILSLFFSLLINAGLIVSALVALGVPHVVVSYLGDHVALSAAIVCILLILAVVTIFLLFAFPSSVFSSRRFLEAAKTSYRLVRSNVWYVVARMFAFIVFVCLVSCLAAVLLDFCSKHLVFLLLSLLPFPGPLAAMQINILFILAFLLYACVVTSVAYALVASMYFELMHRQGIRISGSPISLSAKEGKGGARSIPAYRAVIVIAVLIVALLSLEVQESVIDSRNETYVFSNTVKSIDCENYSAAQVLEPIQQAFATGADIVELDVGETLDVAIVDVINQTGLKGRIVIASPAASVIELIEATDPSIRTAYSMSIAYGDISEIEGVEVYTVDAACITARMVDEIHDEGSFLFAKNVDKASLMVRMLGYNVDGLITDDIPTAEKLVSASRGAMLHSS